MIDFVPTLLRPVIWLGTSRKNVQRFPDAVQKDIGDTLQFIQFGGMPKSAKKLRGVGSGVVEIVTRYDTDTYRTVVAVNSGESVYILHAFKKKSKKGIAVPPQDENTIKRRYRQAMEDLHNDQ